MKKIYLIALLIISPLVLFCQQNSIIVLDSIYHYSGESDIFGFTLQSRIVNLYESNGNLAEATESILGGTTDWHKYKSDYYTYDIKRNVSEHQHVDWYWESDTNEYERYYRIVFSYDSNGNITEAIHYMWDGYANWVEQSRDEYMYNAKGYLIEKKTGLEWNSDINEFECRESRDVYAYDADENLTLEIQYKLDYEYDELLEDQLIDYEYDTNNFVVEELLFRWDKESHVWENWSRESFVNDINGQLSEVFHYEWIYNFNEMVMRYRDVYTYDTEGQLTVRTTYSPNKETNTWEYYYSHWPMAGRSGGRFEYHYDVYGNIAEGTFSFWDSKTADWKGIYQHKYFWSEFATKIRASSADHTCTIYPNPAKDMITIETDNPEQQSIEIASLNGQLIHSTELDGHTHQIDLSSFQKGVYFITIRSEDFVTTRKIIKL